MTAPTDEPADRGGEAVPPPPTATERRKAALTREKEAFGGVKIGSAFFGWLTATGMAVLLTALVAAAGTGVLLAGAGDDAADVAADQGVTGDDITWAGVILVVVLVVLSYYAGGYVAGRMARLDGARQGVAVWLWSLVVSVVVAVLSAVAGNEYDVLDDLNVFPRIPDSLGEVTSQGWVAVLGVVLGSLLGAVLGGLAGMRYHRRVDKAGLGV